MAEGFDYNFNAPSHHYDLTNPDDDDAEYFFATPSRSPELPPQEMEASLPPTAGDAAHDEEVVDPPRETPKRQTPHKVATSCLDYDSNGLPQEFPVRHSPRLAAIAKAARRNNANRGLVDGTLPKAERNHRRSLSDGAIINKNLSKVKKQPLAGKVLPRALNKNTPTTSPLSQQDLTSLGHLTNLEDKRSKKPKKTVPVEFNFATDSRVKSKGPQGTEGSGGDYFIRSLRTHAAQLGARTTHKGPTKVEPFKLHGKEKPQDVKPFVSLAELNMKFYTKTPLRYRTRRSNSADHEQPGAKRGDPQPRLTVAHTPQLSCCTRSRPVLHPSREEEEEKQIQEARKHQFKAQPVDKRIYDHPPVPVVERKKSTMPPTKEPPNLDIKSLMASSAIPHHGVPPHWEKKPTQVKPFSFDARDSEALRRKKEKIQKLLEEEKAAAEFHAQPMPIFDEYGSKGLPPKKPPTPTRQRPFKLHTDIRGNARQDLIRKEMQELETMEQEQRAFHAQPDTVLTKAPFVPEKSKKPLTDISGFSLNTEKRSKQRHDFDLVVKQREDELQAMKKEQEERKRLEEEEEVTRLRREAVHKAQPVPKSKPFVVKRGVLPVTQPISPEFLTTNRISQRTASKMSVNTTVDEFNRDSTYTAQ